MWARKNCYQRISFRGEATLSVPCGHGGQHDPHKMVVKWDGTFWFECICMRPKDVGNQPAGGTFKLGPNYGWLSPPGARGSPTGGQPGEKKDSRGYCIHSVKIPVVWSKIYTANGKCPNKCSGSHSKSLAGSFSFPLTPKGSEGDPDYDPGAGFPDSPGGGIGSDIWEYCSGLLDAHEDCLTKCPQVGEFGTGEIDCYLPCIEKSIREECPGTEWLIPLLWGAEVEVAGAKQFASFFDGKDKECGKPASVVISELIADLSKSYKSFSILDT